MTLFDEIKSKIKFIFNKTNIYLLIFVLLIFILDRISKIKIIDNLNENSFFLNNFINLDLVWNTGVGFGLLSTNSILIYNFVTALITFVILVLIYMAVISTSLDKYIYSVIIGGAFGNYYDRLSYNAVPDFIDLHYKDFHWFTFNVADIFITLGIIAFIIRGFYINNE